MEEKLLAAAGTLAAIVITVVILWFIVLPSSPTETTISEIVYHPESWVNKKVRVNGTIIGPLIYIPERIPPYNYELTEKDDRTIDIGVLYSGELQGASAYVTVIGIVKAGHARGLQGGDLVYYIEANKVEVLELDQAR